MTQDLQEPPACATPKARKVVFDSVAIQERIPHRYPFLLIDRVVHLDLEAGTIIAIKNVTRNEPFFDGHFPNMPIMPGVLQIEAAAQAGAILCKELLPETKLAVLLNIKNAKFRRPVVPGDVLEIHVQKMHISTKGGRMVAQGYVDGQKVAEGEMAFAFMDRKDD